MNTLSSAPKRGFSVVKLVVFLFVCLLILLLGAQPALALPALSSFIGNNFNITPYIGSSNQIAASVAYNNQLDQWLVVWKDDRPTTGLAICGRRVSKNGSLMYNEIVVRDNADDLDMPSVAFDSAQSRYLVVWENDSNGDVEGRVMNADGTAYGDAFTITDCVSCSFPDVVYNPQSDDYLVVWQKNNSLSDADVRGRKVGADGEVDPGGDFDIASGTDVIYQNPAVAVGSSGKYLVVFSYKPSANFNIGGQRLYQNCSKEGSLLSISSDAGDEYSPDVAINLTNNHAFVAWAHDTATGQEVKGRLVRADNTMGSQPTLSAVGGSDEQNVSLSYARVGDPYLATWDNQVDVFGRWISTIGAISGDIFQVTTSGNTEYGPAVTFGTDRYLVAYSNWDSINTQYDIWGRLGTANPGLFLPIVRK